MTAAREQLAFAADLPLAQALAVYSRIQQWVGFAKVGLSLFVEHGPAAVLRFQELGAEVFLDLKLHDIPNTVELAAANAGALGVRLLTVHAQGGEAMLRAAVKGARAGAQRAGKAAPKVLAVTVLTSLSAQDVAATGHAEGTEALAARLAGLAQGAGVEGLVCSPLEVAALRKVVGGGLYLCTPGIRQQGAEVGDQSRVETPAAAIAAGADLLVVGRPLHGAADPVSAAQQLNAEVSGAARRS